MNGLSQAQQTEPFNLMQWIAENRDRLKPPTAAYTVLRERDYMITIVGGPNARTDYHINPREEFYFQLYGSMTLRIQSEGRPKDIPISEGQIYLLPRRVPHAPQRTEGSVGLILEAIRQPDEIDTHAWYCESCNHVLFEKSMYLEILERDMPIVFDAYYSRPELRICAHCGHENKGKPSSARPS
jgi:3-hydroxyanthranilate 3,4-dioxygenase